MRIHRSAREHGTGDADIRHAVAHRLARYDIVDDEGTTRFLLIGADRSANLLAVVLIEGDDGSRIAIHATPLRDGRRHLLRASPRAEGR